MDKNQLIENVKNNYNKAKELAIDNAQAFAVNVRSALEFSVKLFWLIKYGEDVNEKDFSLHEAIKSDKFSNCFERHTITYMHLIRQECNDIIHGEKGLSLEVSKELILNLEKSIKDIELKLNLSILNAIENPIKTEEEKSINTISYNEQDKFICHAFINYYVLNKSDIQVSSVILEIQKKYPNLAYGVIRARLQNLASVCKILNVKNSFNLNAIDNYTEETLNAMKTVLKDLNISN